MKMAVETTSDRFRFTPDSGRLAATRKSSALGLGCVKTLLGMTAPGIFEACGHAQSKKRENSSSLGNMTR
jgi:hypothetical protein